jgi:hypothetical protein
MAEYILLRSFQQNKKDKRKKKREEINTIGA